MSREGREEKRRLIFSFANFAAFARHPCFEKILASVKNFPQNLFARA
jgi:hypothetical protein